MATGSVSVRFSVENAEVVRKALQDLGKDGERALKQLETAGQRPSAGLRAISSVAEEVKGKAQALAGQAGTLGVALQTIGPVGLVAAAAIGGIALALNSASDSATQFAEKAFRLKEAAEITGLTINQFKQLGSAGIKVGMDAEQTEAFITRLTVAFDELRRGGGALFDQLARIDAGLVRELAGARDTTEAIDILARAYSRLNDQAQRNALARAIGGRGGIGGGQLLDFVAAQGGIRGIEESARAAGKEVDEQLVKRAAQLKIEIEEIKKRTDTIWGKAFAVEVLEAQKKSAEFWLSIAQSIERIKNAKSDTAGMGGVGGPEDFTMPPHMQGPPSPPPDQFSDRTEVPAAGTSAPAPLPRSRPATAPISASVDLALMQRWISVLGDAVTPTEQLKLKIVELNAAQDKGGVSDQVRARALEAFRLAQDRAAVAVRTQLGLASEEEMIAMRLRELQELRAKGFIRSAEEMAEAERLMRKEVKETADALAIRVSEFPQLTKLAQDADKLRANLDEGLAGALRGSTAGIIEMAKGTKSLSDGLSELSMRILEAIANALLMKAVVGPIAGALSGGLGSLFASARGNVFEAGRVIPFARGGLLTRPTIFPMANGLGLAGEAGPEAIMPLRRLGNGRLGVESTGTAVQVNVINSSGERASERRTALPGGGQRIDVMIGDMVRDLIRNDLAIGGEIDHSLRNRFGLTPKLA